MMAVYQLLLSSTFVHGLSSASHLLLFLLLSLHWVFKKPSNEIHNRCFYYKLTLYSSISLTLFHLVLCFLNYSNPWSPQIIDLLLTTLAWFVISVYLYCLTIQIPIFLRIWWVFFFLVSCYCLLSDLTQTLLPTLLLIKDVVSIVMGLFFLGVGVGGFPGNKGLQTHLRQPLLSDGAGSETSFSGAGFFSVLTISWVNPLLAVGSKKTLNLQDVPQPDRGDSVHQVFPTLTNHLDSITSHGEQVTSLRLAKALLLAMRKEVVITGILCLLCTLSSYVGPYLISSFVHYLNGRREFKNQGFVLVFTFLMAKLVESVSANQWLVRLQLASVRTRAALIAMVYKKGQTLSIQSLQDHTSGEIINMMAVDAERIGDFSWFLHDWWRIPLQVILALLILYKNVGLASIAALVSTVLVMLANLPLGKWQDNFQEKLMESKDGRMKKTSEILRNMRILKLQGWEMKFLSRIVGLRKNEEGWLKKYLYTTAMTSTIFWGSPAVVSAVTFGACVLMGIPLESGNILSALATFRILQEPIYALSDALSFIVQTKVSLDRVASFLRLNDLQPDVVEKLPNFSEGSIEIKNGYFSWDLSSSSPTLKDINVQVLGGMKVAVCGTVGSGKSSLLSCILGEMPKVSGTVKLIGKKAYVAQSPWIQSGTIEENILFGKEMDRERYETVLEACSLKRDLEILSFGDQTVIGERGINLSGGQKQRIQIARSLYHDADIYLFDDPFSAVDAHTGSHLFKECLLGLLGSKTVIYITHQMEFLPSADLILVMKNGKISQSGKYEDILNSGTDFMELVGAHKKALSSLDTEETEELAADNVQLIEHKEEKEIDADNKEEPISQLVQEEEREKGKVGFQVYWKYITTAYKGALAPMILCAQVFFQVLQIGSNYWMTWAVPVSKDVKPPVGSSTLILVYVALDMGSSVFVLVRAVLLAMAGYKTATILFKKMHTCIFRAPMSFFDATPSGRILNRASTDQSAVDLVIPNRIESVSLLIVQLVGVVAVMSQVSWPVFIVFIPVIGTCIWYQQYYIKTARELSRLIGTCKAPIIQHFSESISGSTTIRSFDQESRFMDTNLKLIDRFSSSEFCSASANQWLSIRLDMLSWITFAFSLIFCISVPEGTINPAVAGLAVTYGLSMSMLLANLIQNICSLENKIISVERLFQYTRIIGEPPLVIEAHRPDSNWPSQGEVYIRDLQVRYAPHMPLVLRGLTCTIRGGTKTGIVGRTGSGKSTLIQALFRIVEPCCGEILIDGLDITTIGLHDLRSRLSIIPQDPTMFEGTVRSNLDPLEEHTDEQIWEALDKCQLGDEVRRKQGKLDGAVTENGENWSMGQRQLVCLGRVLLKRSQVLVLDEATASVDTATDNLLQQTIRQHFSDSTVITIAHRITSVLDSDAVILLDHGLILENDSPSKLLENKSSLFAKLVAEYTVRSRSSHI